MQRAIAACNVPTLISVLALVVAVVGCEKKGPAAAGGKASGKPYEVTLTPPKAGKVGAPLAARIRLVPRGEYKVNLEYPTKLTVDGPAGADPVKRVLKAKDAVKLDKTQAIFAPKAKIKVAGEHKFTATFKFSVCTEKQCELKTEKLSWVASIGKDQ